LRVEVHHPSVYEPHHGKQQECVEAVMRQTIAILTYAYCLLLIFPVSAKTALLGEGTTVTSERTVHEFDIEDWGVIGRMVESVRADQISCPDDSEQNCDLFTIRNSATEDATHFITINGNAYINPNFVPVWQYIGQENGWFDNGQHRGDNNTTEFPDILFEEEQAKIVALNIWERVYTTTFGSGRKESRTASYVYLKVEMPGPTERRYRSESRLNMLGYGWVRYGSTDERFD
jgi:hypothetical protein